MTQLTPQRETADALVAAFNHMDVATIIYLRAPHCERHILPASLGHSPMNNAQYRASLNGLRQVFHNFSLTVNDVVEDKEARRIVMYLSARADSMAGEYVNEYMWTLDFDEDGEKITRSTEFVDAVVNVEFWPKLRAAMIARRDRQRELAAS